MSKIRRFAGCVALLALGALPASASGAFAPVGTIAWPGGDPETGPVEIYSYSWGVSQSAGSGGPHGGGLGSGKVKATDFDFTKGVSEGTPKYFFDVAKGKTLGSARIDLASSPNLSYCLTQVHINQIHDSAGLTDDPSEGALEHVSLSFRKIAIQITINTKQGQGYVVATIDLANNTVSLGSTNACPNLP
jgi:type VI protein secretion system component Hcp